MIEALYTASQAGVEIDLIVRGMCCLRPGVAGLSEQHPCAVDRRALSRALSHLRIQQRARAGEAAYYIGSADWMPRNLDRRVEAMVEVDDRQLQERLREILEVNLADDVLASTLGPDGTWSKVPPTRNGVRHPPAASGAGRRAARSAPTGEANRRARRRRRRDAGWRHRPLRSRSCTAPLRRLVAAQGQARPRRDRRAVCRSGGRGGDGIALRTRAGVAAHSVRRPPWPAQGRPLLAHAGGRIAARSKPTTRSTSSSGSRSTKPFGGFRTPTTRRCSRTFGCRSSPVHPTPPSG